jgi:hypothetical protein
VHEGYNWVYLLSGRLRPGLGEHDIVAVPARSPGPTPALGLVGNPSDKTAEMLGLFSPWG